VLIAQPKDADEAAAVLAEAASSGIRVAILGGGTKAEWGVASAAPGLVLSTLDLNRVTAHRYGDLTATVEAGARFADVNRELARHRQWIPLDPLWGERATIGGIVATNDAGPRRHRYGSPRDLIIGVDIVRPDGVRAKAGGIVVKNVAGYDLARLMTGSFGSLALITSATFKLYPLAQASKTVIVDLQSNAAAAKVVAVLNASQLTPTAIELESPPPRLLIRFESTAASVDAQSVAAAQLARAAISLASPGSAVRIVDGDDELAIWRCHGERPWHGDGVVVKVTLLPSDLAAVLDILESGTGVSVDIAGRAGLGVLFARLAGAAAECSRVVTALRQRVPFSKGSVVALRGAATVPVSPSPEALPIMRAVRRAFDPSGVLVHRRVE